MHRDRRVFTQRFEEDRRAAPWPYHPRHAPFLVKSHYPQIGEQVVERFTKHVTHVVRGFACQTPTVL